MIFLLLQNGNTALHLAAASGLKRVTELLVTHGAPLFLENTDRLTPCDVAMKANFHDIALFLESRMVFVSSYAYFSFSTILLLIIQTRLQHQRNQITMQFARNSALRANLLVLMLVLILRIPKRFMWDLEHKIYKRPKISWSSKQLTCSMFHYLPQKRSCETMVCMFHFS